MEEKILRVGISPIKSYPYHAHIFSIVDAYSKNYLPWLYNYYVQLVVPNDIEKGFRVDYATPLLIRTIPWLEKGRIDRDIILMHWGKMSTFIKECINRNQYIYTLFDVSKFQIYNKKDFFLHDPLIYGYSDFRKEFYLCDNYLQGRYAQGAVSYEELDEGTESLLNRNILDWFPGVFFFSYKKVFDYGT